MNRDNDFYQGVYSPKNPKKYLGNKNPIYRSGWEKVVFRIWTLTAT